MKRRDLHIQSRDRLAWKSILYGWLINTRLPLFMQIKRVQICNKKYVNNMVNYARCIYSYISYILHVHLASNFIMLSCTCCNFVLEQWMVGLTRGEINSYEKKWLIGVIINCITNGTYVNWNIVLRKVFLF